MQFHHAHVRMRVYTVLMSFRKPSFLRSCVVSVKDTNVSKMKRSTPCMTFLSTRMVCLRVGAYVRVCGCVCVCARARMCVCVGAYVRVCARVSARARTPVCSLQSRHLILPLKCHPE